MDFALTDKLDIQIENGIIQDEVNGETTLITAFFTDARIGKMRGYWLDVKSSELWRYDQSRLTEEVVVELRETAQDIAKKLEKDGLYDRIETDVYIDGDVIALNIQCYSGNDLVVNRKFAI